MRHNYVGDEGDYAKLALLRALQEEFSMGVNWYLTEHEERPAGEGGQDDGQKLAHLTDDDWHHLDAALLERMRASLHRWMRGDRDIAHLEELLPGAHFFGDPLPTGAVRLRDRVPAREAWHREALNDLAGVDAVFVDPDNGFQVKSRGPRSKWRCKYATYAEVTDYLNRGQAVVAYQHRPRTTWALLTTKVREDLRTHEVPTAPPGFIAFGSRGFFLMHRDPAVVARLTGRARTLADTCEQAQWSKLAIEVVEPEEA
jgi:hypothetical protein